jgi:hypothetical protein
MDKKDLYHWPLAVNIFYNIGLWKWQKCWPTQKKHYKVGFLTNPQTLGQERLSRDRYKHSSLGKIFVNPGRNKFYHICPL